MQGYVLMTSVSASFIFALKKARGPDRNIGKTNLHHTLELENPTFSHDCASERSPCLNHLGTPESTDWQVEHRRTGRVDAAAVDFLRSVYLK